MKADGMRGRAGELKPLKRRAYNVRLIRRDLSYSIQDIAELYRLHPQAVRRWFKSGLSTIDDRRPILVHGTDLIAFLAERQHARRRTCKDHEFYCCRCRAPRRARGDRVTVRPQTQSKLLLQAICEVCGAPMNRAGSAKRLEDYARTFALGAAGEPHLDGRSDAVVMCQLAEDNGHDELQP